MNAIYRHHLQQGLRSSSFKRFGAEAKDKYVDLSIHDRSLGPKCKVQTFGADCRRFAGHVVRSPNAATGYHTAGSNCELLKYVLRDLRASLFVTYRQCLNTDQVLFIFCKFLHRRRSFDSQKGTCSLRVTNLSLGQWCNQVGDIHIMTG